MANALVSPCVGQGIALFNYCSTVVAIYQLDKLLLAHKEYKETIYCMNNILLFYEFTTICTCTMYDACFYVLDVLCLLFL